MLDAWCSGDMSDAGAQPRVAPDVQIPTEHSSGYLWPHGPRGGPLTVAVVDPDDACWRRFVATRPEATCFHRPEWSQLIATCYGYRAFVLVQRDAAGGVVGGLPVIEV